MDAVLKLFCAYQAFKAVVVVKVAIVLSVMFGFRIHGLHMYRQNIILVVLYMSFEEEIYFSMFLRNIFLTCFFFLFELAEFTLFKKLPGLFGFLPNSFDIPIFMDLHLQYLFFFILVFYSCYCLLTYYYFGVLDVFFSRTMSLYTGPYAAAAFSLRPHL